MSKWRPRLLRSLRHEAISLLEIAAIPTAIAFVFPYDAIGFRAIEHESGRKPSCAFVTLTDEEDVFVIPERPVRGTSAAIAEYAPNSLPPTVAAPPPATIAPDDDVGAEAKQPFSKEDLLKLR